MISIPSARWRWTCKLGPNLRVGVTGWRTNGTSTFRAWRNWWRFTWDASGKPASTKPCLLNWNRLHNCLNSGRTGFAFPLPEEQVTLAALQRMYRHFYIRLTDLLNLTGLVRTGRLDFARLRTSTQRWAIWPGVATLLKIASDYNERAGAGPLPLPAFVLQASQFGAEVTYVGQQFLRVPMAPQGSRLFLRQLIGTGAAHNFRAAARLSLLPALAAAAFVNLQITGDDKGIW